VKGEGADDPSRLRFTLHGSRFTFHGSRFTCHLMTRFPMALLASGVQPPPRQRGWHGGPTPVGAVRGVDAEQASWVPAPRRHSIWALTLHIAYWNYAVRRQLEGSVRGGFPRRPSNWPALPDRPDGRAWAADVALLSEEHERLAHAIKTLRPERLPQRPPQSRRWTYGDLIIGIAAHDAYHTGQIQLLKRLWQERGSLVR
jgi:DinB superfamily